MPLAAPSFWSAEPGASLRARLLRPLGSLYHREVQRRLSRPGFQAPVPVVCVGNVTVGGVGKTPFVRALGEALRAEGHAAHILTRGYGGRLQGPVRVAEQSPEDVGDEPLLLAQSLPVWVSKDRALGARAAADAGADVIVMDDGFQNPSLRKDLSILLFDAGNPLGNGEVFPAGPLREKPEAALARADALVFVGDADRGAQGIESDLPRFFARFEIDEDSIPPGRIVAFCGIGRPERFRDALIAAGREPVRFVGFPDHHAFGPGDLQGLRATARSKDAQLVTTEKDFVRLSGDDRNDITAVTGRMTIGDLPQLTAMIEERL